jgi:hypothetical protein
VYVRGVEVREDGVLVWGKAMIGREDGVGMDRGAEDGVCERVYGHWVCMGRGES